MSDFSTEDLPSDQIIELARSIEDPGIFAPTYLDKTLWGMQRRIAASVDKNENTAVKACHSSGKTLLAAVLTLWFLMKYAPRATVLTTAPTWHQVENLLWGEIRSSVEWARKSGTLALPQCNRTEFRLGEKHYALGLSTNKGVRFQGFHNDRILMIVDEAPGVEPAILEAIEGIRAGGQVSMLQLGNPVVPAGPFYKIFTDDKEMGRWSRFTISAFDTPNFAKYRTITKLLAEKQFDKDAYPMPYLTTPHWVQDRYKVWGPDSPAYISRVEGNFPTQASNAVFPLDWVYRAQRDCKITDTYGKPDVWELHRLGFGLFAGIDVAGAGSDETALCIRVGGHIVHFEVWSKPDPRAEVAKALAPYKGAYTCVTVDSNGIGYYFALMLMDLGYPVVCANFSLKAENEQAQYRFDSQRAESYWNFREWLEADEVTGLSDPETQSQLTSILYEEIKGRVHIESKEDAKKRGVQSPDRAEAVILAFADVMKPVDEEDKYQQLVLNEFRGVGGL